MIKEYAKEAGVTDGSIFTFTQLRKQVATLSQTLHISKWEQDQLATFLGHDIRSVYRQPIEVMDRAKVAKILLSVNKGITISKESLGLWMMKTAGTALVRRMTWIQRQMQLLTLQVNEGQHRVKELTFTL